MADAKRAPITNLTPNVDRILASISYIIRIGADAGMEVTQYNIVKSLFVADREHLNKYGRPVTFDNYAAMKDGPVPSLSYNFLKRDDFAMRRLGGKVLPWSSEPAPHISEKAEVFTPRGAVDYDSILSESDLEELRHALVKVKKLGFKEVRRITHDDPAYKEAWVNNSSVRSFPMSLTLLFNEPNEEQAQNLAFLSQHS